jgi:histidine triad (HIT) family protein
MSENCIFCKIAAGKVPSKMVYQDDLVAVFQDANPLTPVHILVVPKKHYENILDDIPSEVLEAMVHAVSVIVKQTGIDKTGFRLITNTGDDAGQTVHHFHIHIMGGRKLDPSAGEKRD